MFPNNKSSFGLPAANSTFGGGFSGGTTATPFGQSAFGKPATSSFTTTPAFGSTGTSLFGNPAPATGGLFGAPSATPVFGQTQGTQQSAFGGFQSTTPTNNLFGTQQNANTSLFGASTSNQSAFGATKPAFSGFGTNQASGGLFGQQPQQAQATPSLFGQAPTQTNTGLFGSSGFGATSSVTPSSGTVIKFSPLTGTDTMVKNGQTQTINTRHHCITCMKEYENKSLEELRLEDYAANRKGPQQGSQQAGIFGGGAQPSLFGAGASTSNTTGGLFSENKPMFGGNNTMGGFGASTSGVFGQPAQTGGGLFGKPTGFGTTATTSAPNTGFSFNTQTTANPFGQTAVVKPFGTASPQTNTMFGAATSQPSTGFGAQTTAFTGFGAQPNQSLGLFGQNKTPFNSMASTSAGFAFGQNTAATNTASLFGSKPAAAPGFGAGFGSAATPGFGATNTMFGQTQPNSSLFNNQPFKPANTSFSFGQTAPAANTGLGTGLSLGGQSMFGSTAPKPAGGLFGGTTGSMFSSGGFGGGSTFGGASGFGNTLGLGGNQTLGTGMGLMGTQNQQTPTASHQQIMALASMPFGDTPLFRNLQATGRTDELLKPTNPAAQKAVLASNQFKVSPRGNTRLRVKPVVASVLSKKSLFDGIDEEEKPDINFFTPRNSSRRLMLKPATPDVPDQPQQQPVNEESPLTPNFTKPLQDDSWLRVVAGMRTVKDLEGSPRCLPGGNTSRDSAFLENTMNDLRPTQLSTPPVPKETPTAANNTSVDDSAEELEDSIVADLKSQPSHPTGIVLNRIGYYTIPALDEITKVMQDDGTCFVENFTVGREGYGNVFFPESFDVADLNLDEIVHFRHKEVTIYPDDEKKPPVGSGLNRRAQVTLDRVWPIDKTTRITITDPERLALMDYEAKLQRVCAKLQTRFLEYRPQTGSWVFKVEHFSKYGMSESEDDEPLPSDIKKLKLTGPPLPVTHPTKPTTLQPLPPLKPLVHPSHDMYQEDDEDMQQDNHQMLRLKDDDEDDMDHMDSFIQSPSMQLAKDIVTSTHKVQLMKASFFAEENDQDIETVDSYMEMSSFHLGKHPAIDDQYYHDVSDHSLKAQKSYPIFRTQFGNSVTTQTHTSALRTPTAVKSALMEQKPALMEVMPLNDKPDVEVLKYCRDEAPCSTHSILWKYTTLADVKRPFDVMLLKGGGFKSKWGVRSTLLSLITKESSTIMPLSGSWTELGSFLSGRDRGDNSTGFVQRISITGGQPDDFDFFRDSVESHLLVQLENSVMGMEEDCPAMGPSSGVEALHSHCNLAQQLAANQAEDPFITYASEAWELCCALWGKLDNLESDVSDQHHETMVRKMAVSDWLEKVVLPTADKEMADDDHTSQILTLLSANQIHQACVTAQKHENHSAAILLSQLGSSTEVRQLAQQQLTMWQDAEADQFIEPNRLKMFMLVAGIPLLSSTYLINVCDDLDWKRAFAIHLWYLCSPVTSVTDAVFRYEDAFGLNQSDYSNTYATPPVPSHLSESTNVPTYDLCYHLLRLYSTKSHPLERLLNPATHSADPFDYRLSWFLQQTLISLGYSHSSNLSAAIIHTNFANQLESNGLWHWAVFVLLHIRNLQCRRSAILDLLGRHVLLSESKYYVEREDFLLEQLHIPSRWIFEAKATLASSLKQYKDAAMYLIEAGHWNESHQIIMDHIAANDINNEKYEFLSKLLSALEPSERSCTITGWVTGGLLLWDFLTVMKEVETLLADRDLANSYQMEKLNPQLNSLCTRINLLPCPTPVHTMCQAHIAKVTASLVQTCIQLQLADGGIFSSNLDRLVAQLPLPEDNSQQVLNVVAKSCFDSLA